MQVTTEDITNALKGHQIIGELRLGDRLLTIPTLIERSPDHW